MKKGIQRLTQMFKKLNRVLNYPTITIEYPYVLKPIVKHARLKIVNNFNECTACLKCEEKCPTHAISIVSERYSEQSKRPKNSKGEMFEGIISHYQIDYSKCVFCGICVDICPAESLSFDKNFVKPHLQANGLKEDLVHIPRSMRKE
jgi:formate hydrogenlyase subunit 6/NADH:ubiquinone oxidoreductase subunit I